MTCGVIEFGWLVYRIKTHLLQKDFWPPPLLREEIKTLINEEAQILGRHVACALGKAVLKKSQIKPQEYS